jgi:hypothetical protein
MALMLAATYPNIRGASCFMARCANVLAGLFPLRRTTSTR